MPYLKFKDFFSGNQAEGPIYAGEVRNFSPQRARDVLRTEKAVVCDEQGNEQTPPHQSAPVKATKDDEPTHTKEEKQAPRRTKGKPGPKPKKQ